MEPPASLLPPLAVPPLPPWSPPCPWPVPPEPDVWPPDDKIAEPPAAFPPVAVPPLACVPPPSAPPAPTPEGVLPLQAIEPHMRPRARETTVCRVMILLDARLHCGLPVWLVGPTERRGATLVDQAPWHFGSTIVRCSRSSSSSRTTRLPEPRCKDTRSSRSWEPSRTSCRESEVPSTMALPRPD